MSSPTFNGSPIFDSIKADASTFTEGVLYCPEYSKITQVVHFNGEDGNRLIEHGFPDRPWIFDGYISGNTLTALKTRISAIEDQIDAQDYHVLVDSFGNTYANAKVMHLHMKMIRAGYGGEYVARVTITGIVQSMVHDGA